MLTRRQYALLAGLWLALEPAASWFFTCCNYKICQQIGNHAAKSDHPLDCLLNGPAATTFRLYIEFFDKPGDAFLVLFTFVLAVSTIALWSATTDIARQARIEFVAAHPPVIKITQIDIDVVGWAAGQPPKCGRLFITNSGENDARIGVDEMTYGNIVFFVGPRPPPSRPFDTSPSANRLQVKDGILRAGQSKWWKITDFCMVAPDDVARTLGLYPAEKLFIIGRVHFMDTRDVRGTSAFCRVYDPASSRFVATNDPDYEYNK